MLASVKTMIDFYSESGGFPNAPQGKLGLDKLMVSSELILSEIRVNSK